MKAKDFENGYAYAEHPIFLSLFTAVSGYSTETSLSECAATFRHLYLAQGASEYRELFGANQELGTCGPVCLINTSDAVEMLLGRSPVGPLKKMQIIRDHIRVTYKMDANHGLAAWDFAEIGKEFYKNLGLGRVSDKLIFAPTWEKITRAHENLTPNSLVFYSMGGGVSHWLVETGFDPYEKTGVLLDPNHPKSDVIVQFIPSSFGTKARSDRLKYLLRNSAELTLGTMIVFTFHDLDLSAFSKSHGSRPNSDSKKHNFYLDHLDSDSDW